MSELEQVYSVSVLIPNRMEVYYERYGQVFECNENK